MITLAFAQMVYYIFVSLKTYGGDDGLSLPGRSTVGIGTLGNDLVWYYVVLAVLAAVLYGLHRLVHSRFGRVIAAIRENEARAEAIGFPVYRYKLLCFVISGAVAGLAGALIANQSSYVSPSLLHWIQSGTLMIMVILGGVGTLWGGVIAAAVLLLLEHLMAAYRVGWHAGLARSYQITSIFRRCSVLDNLALAVQARSGSSFSLWRPLAAESALFDEARAIAVQIGLADRENTMAATLAHGEQRALEVGLALATQPQLVLLVEHDMDAVFRLADRISVLVSGRLIAT